MNYHTRFKRGDKVLITSDRGKNLDHPIQGIVVKSGKDFCFIQDENGQKYVPDSIEDITHL